MNFLAHIFLSDTPACRVGNFIADTLPISKRQHLPKEIQRGIQRHLEIDAFTDSHRNFKQAKKLLFPHYRHYAGVILDIYNDYFLHKYWDQYSTQTAESLISEFYRDMRASYAILPSEVQQLFDYAVERRWLYKYKSYVGLDEIFAGMDRRTQLKSSMSSATRELRQYEHELGEHFQILFKDSLIQFPQH